MPDTRDDQSPAKLRILMMLDMPWTADLGAPKVSFELAEWLRSRGHTVNKFDINDAFPNRSRLSAFFELARFPGRARAFVRKEGHGYDIIQTEPGTLPFTKADLRFSGRIVVRSNGLPHFYSAANRRFRWDRSGPRGSLGGRMLRWLARVGARTIARVERSLIEADRIIVINQDEFQFVAAALGHRDKTTFIPLGMTAGRLKQFSAFAQGFDQRHGSSVVSFVGSWTPRKGPEAISQLVRFVRVRKPDVRFLLLGTGQAAAAVLSWFAEADREHINVVPSFASVQLPELLSTATVGVLPSHIEGFPLAVLEQLAAGIPVLSYDVPGPREMLASFRQPMMVPVGDVSGLAEGVLGVLALPRAQYVALSSAARLIAESFPFEEVASSTLKLYTDDSTRGRYEPGRDLEVDA